MYQGVHKGMHQDMHQGMYQRLHHFILKFSGERERWGLLTSPGFPEYLPTPLKCSWIIDNSKYADDPHWSLYLYLTQVVYLHLYLTHVVYLYLYLTQVVYLYLYITQVVYLYLYLTQVVYLNLYLHR